MARIIIAEDQTSTRETLLTAVNELGHEGMAFGSGEPALKAFESLGADLIISDVRMPGMDGFALLRAAKNINSAVNFIIMTAYSSIDDAVTAIKLGAADYVTKPFDLREIEAKIRKLLPGTNVQVQRSENKEGFKFDGFLSTNENMKQIYEMVRKSSLNRSSVLIRGESGTGKELIARAIHMNGPDPDKRPFVKVNCAALAEGVLESELFGHEKGAFTGAMAQRKGKFEIAHGGTLFLDEIGDLPSSTQVKLLRVLQEKEFERVGGNQPVKVDVRIITATNKHLEEMIQSGLFREDLFYRLNVIPVYLPPLRERSEDIPDLVRFFVEKNKAMSPVKDVSCSEDLVSVLRSYRWPGNIRELENLMERMTVLASHALLTPDSLPPEVRSRMSGEEQKEAQTFTERATQYEKQLIEQALIKSNGLQVEAAKALGMDRSTLRYKMKKYGLL